MGTRKDMTFIPTPAETPQEVSMIETFARLATSGTPADQAAPAKATLQTQEYLDALWKAAEP
jgi:hypothetical protein